MFALFFMYTQSGKSPVLIDCLAWRSQLTKTILMYKILGLGRGGVSHCWGTYRSATPLGYLFTPASILMGAFFVQLWVTNFQIWYIIGWFSDTFY